MTHRLCLLLVFVSLVSRAEVVRIEIAERSPFADGKSFDPVGAYERIKGRLFIETDPANEANTRISDLKRAPLNARGKVESWTDFFLLKPGRCEEGQRATALRREQPRQHAGALDLQRWRTHE